MENTILTNITQNSVSYGPNLPQMNSKDNKLKPPPKSKRILDKREITKSNRKNKSKLMMMPGIGIDKILTKLRFTKIKICQDI